MKKNQKQSEPKLNLHDLIDRLGASLGALIYRNDRLFSKSLAGRPLRDVVGNAIAEVSKFQPGAWQQVSATGPAGKFDASYLVYRWHGFKTPTLLYIHGSGEQPKDFGRFSDNSFRKIFTKDFEQDINLILLVAPFHDGSQGDYIKALNYLENYVGMLVTSTELIETLADRLKREGCSAVFAAGFSLGGWVVNLHRAFYGKKVDRYIPMCAGTRPDAVFISSHYRKLTAESALANPELLKDVLDFEEKFRANDSNDCYPLLFRYDRLVELEEQQPGYDGMDIRILNKGHFTGQQATGALREDIRRSIIL